ncbi:MAG: protein translocase subunit SecF [Candidatus Krumholzibacteriia bacterium]
MIQFFPPDARFDIMGKRRIAYLISGLLILAGLVSLVAKGGPRWSVDFTGGSVLQVRIAPSPGTGEVRRALVQAGFLNAQVQDFGATDEFLITLEGVESGTESGAQKMRAALAAALPNAKVELRREERVGPKIGGELRTAALNSVLASCVLVVLYLTFRFVFRFGVAALLATLHDLIITFGLFSLLNKEISLQIVAAFLTILGYSLNDTIVVFDRIRENMRLRRREGYVEVLNRSINETLSRTVLSAGTTLLTSLALYFLGGPVIHDFAFCLSFGVLTGTFSSIFIAAPLLLLWHERQVAGDKKRVQPTM